MNGLVTGVLVGIAGIGVFGASVVGLLGATGRLNPEGVKDVPVLNQLITEPEEADAKKGEAGVAEASAKRAQKEKAAQDREAKRVRDRKRARIANERSLFTLKPFAAPTSAAEMREIQNKIRTAWEDAKRERAALEKRSLELDLRESDLETRRQSVQKRMDEVVRKIDELRSLRQKFESDITVLEAAKQKNIKRQAEQLAMMTPAQSSKFLLELGPDKEDLAVQLLVSMDAEPASQILAAMDVKRGAQLIERATRLIKR